MKCPACQSPNIRVYDSRSRKSENGIWRRRKCLGCKHRWSTLEVPVKDDPTKLLAKIRSALEKALESVTQ